VKSNLNGYQIASGFKRSRGTGQQAPEQREALNKYSDLG